ncbi:monoamine oxidase [Solimonas aquatica]|uniref:Tryptophan 2-monooxygenase n=2 Tax=Solimonas aquatica TaxID=489703 RepID=A0A1H9FUQ2_9GAMM|nr:flavin monoamine oxidase family protein [Solimonas aquatica]SEQ41660.1 monoamine oxidase [Solimonas aquatica]
MSTRDVPSAMSRRELLMMIGSVAGSAVSYRAMASLGLTTESKYQGPIRLEGDVKGATVLILGAGIAGMVAALELRKAGYQVQVLEYNNRAGGRNWTLRGGDSYTELGGFTQKCEFDKGLYLNPGPWRIPYHHRGILDYCKRLGVALEPFVQVNYNALVHSSKAFGGAPRRYREVQADFNGHVAELLSKEVAQKKFDKKVTKEDREMLLEALKEWGALDKKGAYVPGRESSERRGYLKPPGGGLSAIPEFSRNIMPMDELLQSRLWAAIGAGHNYEMQTTLFQPVGGMGRIGDAFRREVGNLIRFNAKVTRIQQDAGKVTVNYVDTVKGGATQAATADYCLCTIPLSVLSQIEVNVGAKMQAAISAVPYEASCKVGLQFKRRFWEEDEHIYGGISYTDLPIRLIGYPNTDYHSGGKGVLLGAYVFGPNAYEFTAMSPEERVMKAYEYGKMIHPQYRDSFETGVAVGWHRVPWTLGCAGAWTEEKRAQHYENLCQLDGRILLAGEHASHIPAWQEGAVLSSLDAISRLHKRVISA